MILIFQDCSTKQITTKKQIPNTSCDQVSREICVTPACPLVVENKVCQDVEKTFVTMVPKESCELHPREVCTGKGSNFDLIHKTKKNLCMKISNI